jgi:hypothetical protein
MKTGTDALRTAENEYGSAKLENGNRRPRNRRKRVRERKALKRDTTPSVPPKTSPEAQNKKTVPIKLCTAEKKSPGAQNMKTGPDALSSSENEYGRAKHGTRRPWYRRKRVRARKTRKQYPTPSVPSKMSPGAQNMKTGPDALGTAKNESRSA